VARTTGGKALRYFEPIGCRAVRMHPFTLSGGYQLCRGGLARAARSAVCFNGSSHGGSRVFSYILGIPAHPLLIHFAIVFVVLLVAGSAVYALVPPLRPKIAWAVVLLAVAGPLAAFFARQSGQALRTMLIEQKYPAQIIDQVSTHQRYGNLTFYFSLGLGAAALLLVLVQVAVGRRPAPEGASRRSSLIATVGLGLVVLVLAGFTGYYIFKTGDTGAHMVWASFQKK
jgi:uncharacterized membrane protein